MSAALTSPKQAVAAMVEIGAVFTIRQRADGLGVQFIYKVSPGGDLQACRKILAAVKGKAPAFFTAFQAYVQEIAERAPT